MLKFGDGRSDGVPYGVEKRTGVGRDAIVNLLRRRDVVGMVVHPSVVAAYVAGAIVEREESGEGSAGSHLAGYVQVTLSVDRQCGFERMAHPPQIWETKYVPRVGC